MSQIHGKDVYVSLDGEELSEYSNNVDFGREADSHDTTTFGRQAKRYKGGLRDGTCQIQGIYESGATGPAAVIDPLIGENVELIYRPEGTGDGKPETTVEVLVLNYNETAPVADMITWTSDLQFSDLPVTADQVSA